MAAASESIQINPRFLVSIGALSETRLQQLTETHRLIEEDAKEKGQQPRGMISWLLDEESVTMEQVMMAFAAMQGLSFFRLEDITPPRHVLDLIPHHIAREHRIVPVSVNDNRVRVVIVNPTGRAKNALELAIGHIELEYAIATRNVIDTKVAEYYSAASEAATIMIETEVTSGDMPSLDAIIEGSGSSDQGVSKNVRLLLTEGLQLGASDIHVDPYGKGSRVRYRVDGQLRVSKDLVYPPDVARLVVSRIKVMANLDMNQYRHPQDGRITFSLNGKNVDLRIAIIPTASDSATSRTEKVVIRILSSEFSGKPLSALDFTPSNLKRLREAMNRKSGMVLVTGPTGSGKSTTLYSGIVEIAKDNVNILTVEDPVEFKFKGVSQVQANPDIGLTFPIVLRSFLRADPDIILVGEIRDQETAEIAIRAALTGHLVLSTLHTDSAAATISRLVEMGIEPYLISDALTASLSQRLVRRLCTRCRVEHTPVASVVERLSGEPAPAVLSTVFRANESGCPSCVNGYKGRLAIHELLPATADVKRAIIDRKTPTEIEELVTSQGYMRTLLQDGWDKILLGLTDVDQIAALSSGDDTFSLAVEAPVIEDAPPVAVVPATI